MTFKDTLIYFYLKILRINDTPHKIALGVGLGVFSGVLPATGPIFSFLLAVVFRANKASAILGCILVNTWISLLLIIPSVKVGAALFGVRWVDLKADFYHLKNDFEWNDLFTEGARDVILPVAAGFLLCSLLIGLFSYVITLILIKNFRRIREKRRKAGCACNPPRPPFRKGGFRGWLFLFCAAVFFLQFFPIASAEGAGQKNIIILTTSDIESQLDEYPYPVENGKNKETKLIGGMARIAGAVKNIRSANPGNVILVSSGDDLMGKYFSIFHGKETYTLMNKIGYDAVLLGNHEFDYGIKALKDAVDIASFPIVVSNMEFEGTTLFKKINGYIVKEVGGVKVGFIGLMTPDVRQITRIEDPIKVNTDIYAAADELTGYLKDIERVDIVVALTHIGVELDKKLARKVRGIDVICGGHSHTLLPGGCEIVANNDRGENTIIVESGEKGGFLGRLDLYIRDKKITGHKWETIMLDNNIPADPEAAAIVESFKKQLSPKIKIGESAVDLNGLRAVVRKGESNLGNMIADAMRERFDADIAFVNGGGIRGDKIYPKGDIYSETILEFFPFENYVVKLSLKGKEIKEVLELGVCEYEKGHGRFLQVSGLKYVFDPVKESAEFETDAKGDIVGIKKKGKRVSDIFCMDKGSGYKPCEDEKSYSIAVGSYIAEGGDGYFMFKNKDKVNTFVTVQNVVEDYIKEKKKIEPVVEGRIKLVNSGQKQDL